MVSHLVEIARAIIRKYLGYITASRWTRGEVVFTIFASPTNGVMHLGCDEMRRKKEPASAIVIIYCYRDRSPFQSGTIIRLLL